MGNLFNSETCCAGLEQLVIIKKIAEQKHKNKALKFIPLPPQERKILLSLLFHYIIGF
jgi:hypothetical protein